MSKKRKKTQRIRPQEQAGGNAPPPGSAGDIAAFGFANVSRAKLRNVHAINGMPALDASAIGEVDAESCTTSTDPNFPFTSVYFGYAEFDLGPPDPAHDAAYQDSNQDEPT